jgi:hypothetical protein
VDILTSDRLVRRVDGRQEIMVKKMASREESNNVEVDNETDVKVEAPVATVCADLYIISDHIVR